METTHLVLVILALLSCISGVLSSNPDSVGVQDSSEDSDDSDQKKSAPLLSSENQGRSISSDRQRYLPSVPSIQPVLSDVRRLWRIAVPYSYVSSSVIKLKDSRPIGTFFSLRRSDFRRNRPDFVVPTDKVTTIAKEEAVTDKPQNVPIAGDSSMKETKLNRETDESSDEEGEADSFSSGGPRNPGSSKNAPEGFPGGISYRNRNDQRRPAGEQVPSDFGDDVRDQNGRGTTIHRPASFTPSSSRGQDGIRTSYDRPFSYRPSSNGERIPVVFPPDASRQDGRGTSDDRPPSSFNPSSTSGQGGIGTSRDRPFSYRPPSNGERVSVVFPPDASGQDGRGTSVDHPPSSFTPSSSSGQGGIGTSRDRPLSLRPSSTWTKVYGDYSPATNGHGGRGTSGDRPPSPRPSSSDSSYDEEFDPNASSDPEDYEDGSFIEDSEEIRTTPPPPPLEECTARRKISRDSNLLSGVINDFAFKLIDRLKLETNFVVSPLSIFMALSMCYLGSDGATKSELETVLGLSANSIHGMHLHKGIKDLLSMVLPNSGEDYLQIANGLFLGQNFTVNGEFEENVKQFYEAELKNVDFENPDLSMPMINEWVSKATKNMITSLTDAPPPALTRLLLISAMYFKGVWKTQFPSNFTRDEKFTTSAGNSRMIPTMLLIDEKFPFLRSDEHRHSFVKLPYEGDQVSMVIALPYTAQEKPMPNMSDDIMCSVRDAMANTKLDTLAIPKFRLEYSKSLRQPLERLGVSTLFNPNTKDLSRMREENDVHVSAVLHKAVIEVNERGTTAAAVTGVKIVPLTLRRTKDFIANHPFAFYLVHESSGLVLFYGKFCGIDGRSDIFPNRRQPARTRPPSSNRRNPSETAKDSRRRLPGAVTYEK